MGLQEKTEQLAKEKMRDLKEELGDIYEENEEQIAYFVNEIAILEATSILGDKSEQNEKDLEYLTIGLKSQIINISYQVGNAAQGVLESLLKIAIQSLFSATRTKLT